MFKVKIVKISPYISGEMVLCQVHKRIQNKLIVFCSPTYWDVDKRWINEDKNNNNEYIIFFYAAWTKVTASQKA